MCGNFAIILFKGYHLIFTLFQSAYRGGKTTDTLSYNGCTFHPNKSSDLLLLFANWLALPLYWIFVL